MAKILLVEDDKNLQEIYAAQLMAEGHTIVSAYDGEQGLSMAASEHPDLIITDAMMPRVSGLQFLDILRSTPATANIKVIAMTALSQADDRAQFEKLGVERFLVKSQVTLEDVARVVNEVLSPADVSSPPMPVTAVEQAAPVVADPVVSSTVAPEASFVPAPDQAVTAPAAIVSEPMQPVVAVAQPAAPAPSAASATPLPNAASTVDEQNDLMQQIQSFVATSPIINNQVVAPVIDAVIPAPAAMPVSPQAATPADPAQATTPVVNEPVAAPVMPSGNSQPAANPNPAPLQTQPATPSPATTPVNQADLDNAL